MKFALYNSNGSKISSGSIPTSGRVLLASGEVLKTNTTNYYTVIIWLNDDGTNQNYEMSNSFVGGFMYRCSAIKISITALAVFSLLK